MAGDAKFQEERLTALVDIFGEILHQGLKLQEGEVGMTDTKTFIQVPFKDPEAYLIGEHELSHCLFESDLLLAQVAVEKIVERLLLRAGMKSTQPEAVPYKGKLHGIVHHLWNVLEDWRCCGLWSQLYPGGGSLLEQRWKDILQFEYPDEESERDLIPFLKRLAGGVRTPSAPPDFLACEPAMSRAMNLVVGVDASACLAITAKLVDDIADTLLQNKPPDPNKQKDAKQKLQALAGATGGPPPPGSPGDKEDDGLGGEDLKLPPGADAKKMPASKKLAIERLLNPKADEVDHETGTTPFSDLLNAGAEKMEARLEEAKKLLGVPKKGTEEIKKDILVAACAKAGIKGVFVDPIKPLPAATPTAAKIRFHIDQVKMKKKRRLVEEGDDIDLEAFIEASLSDDFDDTKFYEKEFREGGLELLVLIDLSGSMCGYGLAIVEAALADIYAGCESPTVQIHTWGFSNYLFFFRKKGSPVGAKGVYMCGTDMVQALEVAAEWARVSKATRAIILATDGMPTSCRHAKSTGSALGDLHEVLSEMERDRLVFSILGIGQPGWEKMYDQGFGPGRYAMLSSAADLATALPEAAKKLVEAHINRRNR
jgi:hypothetical protein